MSEELRNNPERRARMGTLVSVLGILLNVLLCVVKGLVGLAISSVAMVADAINNLSDASSNIISMVGFRLGRRPADRQHPYGHGRFEYLAGMVVAVLVTSVGLELIRSSVESIMQPEPLHTSPVAFLVLVVSIVIKLAMMALNMRVSASIVSEPLRATALDARNDAIATGAVLACIIVSAVTGINMDGWAGLAVGIFILVSGLMLVRDTINLLLGKAPTNAEIDAILQRILSYPHVLGTHDLMVHDYGPGRKFASAHVEMPAELNPLESHMVLDQIEQDFLSECNLIMTLHYDPLVTDDPELQDIRNFVAEQATTIDERLSVHDVRRVVGPTHTNIIFDCVKPYDVVLTEEELTCLLTERVQGRYPRALCKITFDESYVSSSQ
ncbi:cation diffusion facilitator family transporter [Collinsella sp. zg1085]|nr:cation diffusion facilitator family transporter [Collinsella sp. zg1085]